MPIDRNSTPTVARFSVGLNIILTGSKQLTVEQQDELLKVDSVRVLIVDAKNPDSVLVDEEAYAKLFNTGSVGYGVHRRDVAFETQE